MIKSLNSTGLEKRSSGEWEAKGSLGYCVRRASCRVQWKSAWCSLFNDPEMVVEEWNWVDQADSNSRGSHLGLDDRLSQRCDLG